jgi:hypothetical protein
MKKYLGYAMLATPFAIIALLTIVNLGIWAVVAIFGGTAALIAWITVAVRLTE